MNKIYTRLLLILFTLYTCTAAAQNDDDEESIAGVKKIDGRVNQESEIASIITERFLLYNGASKEKQAAVKEIAQYFPQYLKTLQLFIDIQIYRRNKELKQAEQTLKKAVNIAERENDAFAHYLYTLHLAYVYTDLGDPVSAVYNYRAAKHEADKLNDPEFNLRINIGLSDLYYKTGLFEQSLFYLDEIQRQVPTLPKESQAVMGMIYYNKAENFFRLKKVDSLSFYTKKFIAGNDFGFNHDWVKKRLTYYTLLLQNKNAEAIPIIQSLLKDKTRHDAFIDQWALAQTYFKIGKLDSARLIITQQINNPAVQQQGLLVSSLYQMIAQIDAITGHFESAYQYTRKSVDILDQRLFKIGRVGDVSSQMRFDEMQEAYNMSTLKYKKERIILIFAILVAILIILVGVMLYRNIRQKHKYEKLLYADKRRELAFINSHEVRRHLSNILGLCHIIKVEQVRMEEIDVYKDYLQDSAQNLDEAIKNIEHKLNEH